MASQALRAGFSALTLCESQIIAAKVTPPPEPTPHELRCRRKAAKRRLKELQQLGTGLIDFDITPATREAENELESLEQQMRAALGIDSEPAPRQQEATTLAQFEFIQSTPRADSKADSIGVEQASVTAAKLSALEKEIASALRIAPTPAPVEPPPKRGPQAVIRRQIEVVLEIQRHDGSRLPFYHVDDCVSSLEAQLNAEKKARKYGLSVLRVKSTNVVERECNRAHH